jgi:hypothetical protein
MKFIVALVLLFSLTLLVRRNLLRVDLLFPFFGAIVILGFFAINDNILNSVAAGLGIVYAPLAIILIAIFIVLALVTTLSIIVNHLRSTQIAMIRRLAEIDLDSQEAKLSSETYGIRPESKK